MNNDLPHLTRREKNVLRALMQGPVTTEEVRRIGSLNGPANICELRRAGFEIVTIRRTLYDEGGTPCRRAVYHLAPGQGAKAAAALKQLEFNFDGKPAADDAGN